MSAVCGLARRREVARERTEAAGSRLDSPEASGVNASAFRTRMNVHEPTQVRDLRKPVEPFVVESGLSADAVLERMERISFQGRNLATARRIWEKMLASDATIFLGIAGALSAGGMRLVIAHLIERRYVDCVVSTGANLYHDLHETRGRRHFMGAPTLDDAALAAERIDRVDRHPGERG